MDYSQVDQEIDAVLHGEELPATPPSTPTDLADVVELVAITTPLPATPVTIPAAIPLPATPEAILLPVVTPAIIPVDTPGAITLGQAVDATFRQNSEYKKEISKLEQRVAFLADRVGTVTDRNKVLEEENTLLREEREAMDEDLRQHARDENKQMRNAEFVLQNRLNHVSDEIEKQSAIRNELLLQKNTLYNDLDGLRKARVRAQECQQFYPETASYHHTYQPDADYDHRNGYDRDHHENAGKSHQSRGGHRGGRRHKR